jgi:hypothetical protein
LKKEVKYSDIRFPTRGGARLSKKEPVKNGWSDWNNRERRRDGRPLPERSDANKSIGKIKDQLTLLSEINTNLKYLKWSVMGLQLVVLIGVLYAFFAN